MADLEQLNDMHHQLAAQSHTRNFQKASDTTVHCSVLHHLHTDQNSSDANDYVIARKMVVLMDTDYSQHTRENDVAYFRGSRKIPTVKHLQQKCMTAEGMYFESLSQ